MKFIRVKDFNGHNKYLSTDGRFEISFHYDMWELRDLTKPSTNGIRNTPIKYTHITSAYTVRECKNAVEYYIKKVG